MSYLILSGLLFVLLAISFYVSGCELLAPAPLLCLGMLAGSILALIGTCSWNSVVLEFEAMAVVLLGVTSFVGGSALTKLVPMKGMVNGLALIERSTIHTRRLDTWKYFSITLILLFAVALRCIETIRIAGDLGMNGVDFPAMAKAVRYATSNHMGTGGIAIGEGFSLLERQLEKVVRASGFVFAGLIARDVALFKKGGFSRKTVLSGLNLFLACVFILLSGSRATVFYFAVAGVTCWFIFRLKETDSPLRESRRMLVVGGAIALVGIVSFYLLSSLIGRKAHSGLTEYVTFYFGCGIPALQQVLERGIDAVGLAGTHTFYNLYAFLYKLGFIDQLESASLAWIQIGDYNVNVFTAFATYFLDFGYLGVVALSMTGGFLLSLVYRLARVANTQIIVFLAGYVAASTFDMVRVEFIFSALLSPYGLLTVLLMVLISLFLGEFASVAASSDSNPEREVG